ncbi:MAG: hypothetical protein EOO97_00020 [Pedobacter sp.]|nr:MAG: hypothetical protein EOO97_00020 [Pedobacter sp.]
MDEDFISDVMLRVLDSGYNFMTVNLTAEDPDDDVYQFARVNGKKYTIFWYSDFHVEVKQYSRKDYFMKAIRRILDNPWG